MWRTVKHYLLVMIVGATVSGVMAALIAWGWKISNYWLFISGYASWGALICLLIPRKLREETGFVIGLLVTTVAIAAIAWGDNTAGHMKDIVFAIFMSVPIAGAAAISRTIP